MFYNAARIVRKSLGIIPWDPKPRYPQLRLPYHSGWWNMLKLTPKNTRMTGQTWFFLWWLLGETTRCLRCLLQPPWTSPFWRTNDQLESLSLFPKHAAPTACTLDIKHHWRWVFGWFSIAWGFWRLVWGRLGKLFGGEWCQTGLSWSFHVWHAVHIYWNLFFIMIFLEQKQLTRRFGQWIQMDGSMNVHQTY